ncbi:hypothetical protein SBFV1_gp65 [Sulfolobales Beppu filamentous phage 1]|uniref:Uncharacterized protein n=1 Tax=Sulfolobales Beppu filamentous phage 1 TaxID=2493122 RepID=A0A3S8NES4_9VIRU|nr:hypothetical protein SBFV1_gp65 [Sulfolobales Beppu filamentous phage 1]
MTVNVINAMKYHAILDTTEFNSEQPPIIIPNNSESVIPEGVYNVFVYQKDIRNFGYLYTAFIYGEKVMLGLLSYPFDKVIIEFTDLFNGYLEIDYMDLSGKWHTLQVENMQATQIHTDLEKLTNTAYVKVNNKCYQIVNGIVKI